MSARHTCAKLDTPWRSAQFCSSVNHLHALQILTLPSPALSTTKGPGSGEHEDSR